MFLGEYNHALDEKGRLAIPVKFRDALRKGAVVTRGLDNSLVIYAMTEWKVLATKLANLPISQQNSRAFARLMLAGAMDVSIDKQGRFGIPEYLRQYAGMKKNVVVAGLYNRLELWDASTWEAYKKKTESASSAIAEQLGELGI
ncbi:cell division/cell wall cluster transcriptional repressor MraZ [Candidatus Uhrbacteria bacterium CG10_big_fil_rev_8_21_14_0_10_50_16]|uniref:Transcriptional regulator MraZ n=1 Tax=Candidatus Uhrbacteria bacterium CG10_big_fil_rev_8_21_14_0_10_50_16 TaxID=1975039 RepID=A0A2H0RNM6_9BACT|nr:MAG: cell division/cell wall cluster transcriptional repressor MraZ [Candidatus Uhrbacteria bacterium CG10_big_fil_rev_8_21_14_0_10_50_16]